MKKEKLYPHNPDWVSLPGNTLQEIIGYKNLTQKELAERTGVTPQHINRIISGEAPISPDMAILLERVVGTSAEFWNRLEAIYQTRKASLEAKKALLEHKEILKNPSVKELIRRKAIEKHKDVAEQMEAVLGFFAAGSVTQLERLWTTPLQAALRYSPSLELDGTALASWLRLGEKVAESMECQPFHKENFRETLDKIRDLPSNRQETFLSELSSLCTESGVAVAFVKEMPGAAVCGATKWLSPNKALLLLAPRRKKDQLLFSFFHEAAHLLFDDKKLLIVDAAGETEKSKSEKKADKFAKNMLCRVPG
jgi:addiction module HigA family antidote